MKFRLSGDQVESFVILSHFMAIESAHCLGAKMQWQSISSSSKSLRHTLKLRCPRSSTTFTVHSPGEFDSHLTLRHFLMQEIEFQKFLIGSAFFNIQTDNRKSLHHLQAGFRKTGAWEAKRKTFQILKVSKIFSNSLFEFRNWSSGLFLCQRSLHFS